ncbi:MAG: ABC transporter permease [Candidatus Firestonebacteria bacterium]
MRRIFELAKKEFIQTFRDKKMLGVIFIAPIIQLILLGYAVTTDIKHIYVGVWDADKSQYSRELTNKILNSGYFDFKGVVENDMQLEENFKKSNYDFVLYFPPDFSRKIKRFERAQFQIIADGSDSNLTAIGMNYLNQIIIKENNYRRNKNINKISGMMKQKINLSLISPEIRVRYNPELKSSNFMVPVVIGLILTLTTMMLTSMAITREKEAGTIEQLIVSPLKPLEIIAGKTLPFLIIAMADVVLVLTISTFIFNIYVKGSLLLLFASSLLFVLSTLGVGLFISTISKTQQQAMLTSFMFNFPSMIISGFTFPISNMPLAIQYLSYIIPLRYFFIIIRGIILKGNGIAILWPEILSLFVFGITILFLSALRFQKKLG